jgi:hypothetical protein
MIGQSAEPDGPRQRFEPLDYLMGSRPASMSNIQAKGVSCSQAVRVQSRPQ